MGRTSDRQTQQKVLADVEAFFDQWNNEKKFPDEQSLLCLTTEQLRRLFRTVKNNLYNIEPYLIYLLPSNTSGKLLLNVAILRI